MKIIERPAANITLEDYCQPAESLATSTGSRATRRPGPGRDSWSPPRGVIRAVGLWCSVTFSWAFLAVAIVLVLTPGADFAVIVRNTISHGRRVGAATTFGVTAAE